MSNKVFKGFKGSPAFFSAVEQLIKLSSFVDMPEHQYKDLSHFIRLGMSRQAKALLVALDERPELKPLMIKVKKDTDFSVLDTEDDDGSE